MVKVLMAGQVREDPVTGDAPPTVFEANRCRCTHS